MAASAHRQGAAAVAPSARMHASLALAVWAASHASASARMGEAWRPERCPSVADWIVVGGGAAGCAAAAALADAGHDVLVLERGPSDQEVASTQSASGWPKSINDAGQYIRWTEGVWGVVGRVLGGGTSLNGGLYLADRPEWFARHMPGVDMGRMNASYYELLGQLATPSQPSAFGEAWNKVLQETGHGTAKLSHAQLEWPVGRPYLPYSTFNQTAPGVPRVGAASLLHRRAALPNLRVATHAEVQRVLFEGNRAVGVSANVGKWPMRRWCSALRARKGVIVSAGAVFTPQLLQLSGVGPRPHLEKLGVKVVSDLPVGENFVDRLVVSLGVMSPVNIPLTVGYTIVVDNETDTLIEGVGGGRVAAEMGVASVAFVPPKMRSRFLRFILKKVFASLPKGLDRVFNRMIQPVALQTNTHSRGSVMAAGRSASQPPSVTAKYFDDPRDWQSQQQRFERLLRMLDVSALAGFATDKVDVDPRIVRSLRKRAPMLIPALSCLFKDSKSTNMTKVTIPCLPASSDPREARDRFLRQYGVSSYHYFGTAAAGPVVDPIDFGVKGTQGLHVVDASVIPAPTTINPQGTIMALGHYLGSLLGAQQRLGRASETAILFP